MRSGRAKTPVALARALARREPSIARRNRGAAPDARPRARRGGDACVMNHPERAPRSFGARSAIALIALIALVATATQHIDATRDGSNPHPARQRRRIAVCPASSCRAVISRERKGTATRHSGEQKSRIDATRCTMHDARCTTHDARCTTHDARRTARSSAQAHPSPPHPARDQPPPSARYSVIAFVSRSCFRRISSCPDSNVLRCASSSSR